MSHQLAREPVILPFQRGVRGLEFREEKATARHCIDSSLLQLLKNTDVCFSESHDFPHCPHEFRVICCSVAETKYGSLNEAYAVIMIGVYCVVESGTRI